MPGSIRHHVITQSVYYTLYLQLPYTTGTSDMYSAKRTRRPLWAVSQASLSYGPVTPQGRNSYQRQTQIQFTTCLEVEPECCV